jgi:hypothetical protein
MKLTFTAVALSFSVADEAGNVIASHSAENVESTLDVRALLTNISDLAHLFNKLDATHNTRHTESVDSVTEVPLSEGHSVYVQALIDADLALCNVIAEQQLADTAGFRKAVHELRALCAQKIVDRRELLTATSTLTRQCGVRFTNNDVFDTAYHAVCDARRALYNN